MESERNFTVSTSVIEEVVIVALSVQATAKSETTTCNRV